MVTPGPFIIRVYGIVMNNSSEVLVSDEFRLGMQMTKFPGGGLIFGEGTIDCLVREFREECNGQELTRIHHFYTTDYFQPALFYENSQLISIYYLAELIPPLKFKISERPFDFEDMTEGNQSFRWLNLKTSTPSMLSFPVDRTVLTLLTRK